MRNESSVSIATRFATSPRTNSSSIQGMILLRMLIPIISGTRKILNSIGNVAAICHGRLLIIGPLQPFETTLQINLQIPQNKFCIFDQIIKYLRFFGIDSSSVVGVAIALGPMLEPRSRLEVCQVDEGDSFVENALIVCCEMLQNSPRNRI